MSTTTRITRSPYKPSHSHIHSHTNPAPRLRRGSFQTTPHTMSYHNTLKHTSPVRLHLEPRIFRKARQRAIRPQLPHLSRRSTKSSTSLLVYFLRNEQEATRLGLDLNKGILLTGPIGCGKTKLMTLMRLVPAHDRFFVLKACRDISFEFGTKGFPSNRHLQQILLPQQRPTAHLLLRRPRSRANHQILR